jgi:O-antigen/teichoic acid export membrane protein
MACSLLLSVTFARLVSQEMYGQWSYILSVIGICAILTLPGMHTAITQSVASGNDRILIEGTKQRFKWSTLGILAMIGIGLYYFISGSPELGKGFLLASLFFPFYQNFDSYEPYFSGKKQFDRLARYRIAVNITAVLITILVIYLSRNLMLIVVSYLFSFSLLRGYFFKRTLGSITRQGHDPEAISFGNHMTVAQIPVIIRQQYDRLVVALFLSFPELAVYTIALGFASLLGPLSSIISSLILPKLSQMDKKTAYLEVRKRWLLVVAGAGVICGLLILLCPYIIPFLYSQKYADSVLYAQLLLISVVIAAPVTIISKALLPSQRRVKDLYKLRIYGSITEIALLTVLVLKFGLMGAVIAIIAGQTFTTLYSLKLAGFLSFRRV